MLLPVIPLLNIMCIVQHLSVDLEPLDLVHVDAGLLESYTLVNCMMYLAASLFFSQLNKACMTVSGSCVLQRGQIGEVAEGSD